MQQLALVTFVGVLVWWNVESNAQLSRTIQRGQRLMNTTYTITFTYDGVAKSFDAALGYDDTLPYWFKVKTEADPDKWVYFENSKIEDLVVVENDG